MEPNPTAQTAVPEQNIKKNKLPKWLTTVTLFSKLLAMFFFMLFPFVGFYLGMQYQKLNQSIVSQDQSVTTPSPTPRLIGGDKDKYGCLTGAGYSWCGAKNKCLRVWEEPCSATPSASTTIDTSTWKTYIDNQVGISLKYPSDWQYKIVEVSNIPFGYDKATGFFKFKSDIAGYIGGIGLFPFAYMWSSTVKINDVLTQERSDHPGWTESKTQVGGIIGNKFSNGSLWEIILQTKNGVLFLVQQNSLTGAEMILSTLKFTN